MKKCVIIPAHTRRGKRVKSHVRCRAGGDGDQANKVPAKSSVIGDYHKATRATKAAITKKDHIKAIDSYTGAAYRPLNHLLRKGEDPNEHLKKISDDLSEAISIAPKIDAISYRGVGTNDPELFKSFVKNSKKGAIFTDQGFVSTSRRSDVAYQFAGTHQYRISFFIKSKRGVAIEQLSSLKMEEEILFDKNSSFKVFSSKKSGNVLDVTLVDS